MNTHKIKKAPKSGRALQVVLMGLLSLGGLISQAQAMPDTAFEALVAAETKYAFGKDQGNLPNERKLLEDLLEIQSIHLSLAKDSAEALSQSTESYLALAGLLAAEGHFERARVIFQRLLALQPPLNARLQAQVHQGLAGLALYQSLFAEALSEADSALHLDPKLLVAQRLQRKAASYLERKQALSACDKIFPELHSLSAPQLAGCLHQSAADDPNLNVWLYLLGESKDHRYVTTVSPYLKLPRQHPAALQALGQLLTIDQLFVLAPYQREAASVPVYLAVLKATSRELPASQTRLLGAALIRQIEQPDTQPQRRLQMIELLGRLHHKPALALFTRLKKWANQLPSENPANYLADKTQEAMTQIDYAESVKAAVAEAEASMQGD